MSNCIVTGGSSNDAAPMGVLLLNLKQTQHWIDQVVIYHDGGISSKDKLLMNQIMPVKFIKYEFPGDTSSFNEIIRYVYTPTIFCKYECLRLLDCFDKVMWTDYDVIFLKNVSELLKFRKDASGMKTLVAKEGDASAYFGDQIRGKAKDEMAAFCPLDSLSIFTGLMVFSAKLKNASHLYEQCISLTSKYGAYLVHPEQAVLDMATRICGIEPDTISWAYAYSPQWNVEIQNDPKILHAVSQPKYWNGLNNPTWNANYAQWLALGGSPWKPLPWYSTRNIKKRIGYFIGKLMRIE